MYGLYVQCADIFCVALAQKGGENDQHRTKGRVVPNITLPVALCGVFSDGVNSPMQVTMSLASLSKRPISEQPVTLG